MKVWVFFLFLGLSTAGFFLNVIRYEHRIAELTARADSLQAECDSLHQMINTSPRYMKNMVWYFSAAEPEDTIVVAPNLLYVRLK